MSEPQPLGREVSRQYETLDGAAFDPPYGEIHHRDETLWGLGDPVLALRWDRDLGAHMRVGVRGGLLVPLGDTTQNPEPLSAQSLPHQHMQIGSGTFDPILGITGAWRHEELGVFGRADAVVPLYESSKGYRGGEQIDVAIGPGYYFRPDLFGFAQIALSHTGEEAWDGTSNEVSKRDALRLVLGGHAALSERWRIGPILQLELASRAVGGSFDQPFIGTLTITYGTPIPRGRGSL